MFWQHLVASALLAGSALAGAETHRSADQPTESPVERFPSSLTLTVIEDGLSPDQQGQSRGRSVLLTCDPHGGNHPDPMAACADLALVGDRFEAIEDQAICTMIYQPYTVSASGTVAGTPVDYERTYSNQCQLSAATGQIFAF